MIRAMVPIQSKLNSKTLHSQVEENERNVHDFTTSAERDQIQIPIKYFSTKTAETTGVPSHTC